MTHRLSRAIALLPLALGLCGCSRSAADSARANDTGEPPPFTGPDECSLGCPAFITDVTYDCGITAPSAWTYTMRTEGWSDGGAVLNIYETSAWDADAPGSNAAAWVELGHELSQGDQVGVDFDANREWDQWSLTLTIVDSPSNVATGTRLTTLFSCDLYNETLAEGGLAWRLYAFVDDDFDATTPATASDCWDFGHQPEEISLIDGLDPLCRRQD